MKNTDLNITKIMADTMGLPVYHTVRKSRVFYDSKGERVPENWLPDGAVLLADYFYSMTEKIRLHPGSERLPQQWKMVFDMLPVDGGHFTTSEFLQRTDMEGISEITAKRWLSKQSKPGGVLVNIKHGVYAAKN